MVTVSVIIPVYNMEKYINECIDSVLSQSLENLEVICIDDGSTDGSRQILRNYQQKDKRVRLFLQENRGPGLAKNRGMSEARGKYIAFLDADDFWHDESVLDKIVSVAEAQSSNITGAFWGFYKEGKYKRDTRHFGCLKQGGGGWAEFRDEQDCFNYGSYLFSRKFLTDNGIVFPTYYKFEDPPFLAEALIKVGRYYMFPVDWYCVRPIYKRELSTARNTVDFLNGVNDVLKIAHEYRMEKLSGQMLDQIDEFGPFFIREIAEGNTVPLGLLCEVGRYIADGKRLLAPFGFISSAIRVLCEKIADAFWTKIRSAQKAVIYGAGKYGFMMLEYIERQGVPTEIVFAETVLETEKDVFGKKCVRIDTLVENRDDVIVIIAVAPVTRPELVANVKRLGFKNYACMDMELMAALECVGQDGGLRE